MPDGLRMGIRYDFYVRQKFAQRVELLLCHKRPFGKVNLAKVGQVGKRCEVDAVRHLDVNHNGLQRTQIREGLELGERVTVEYHFSHGIESVDPEQVDRESRDLQCRAGIVPLRFASVVVLEDHVSALCGDPFSALSLQNGTANRHCSAYRDNRGCNQQRSNRKASHRSQHVQPPHRHRDYTCFPANRGKLRVEARKGCRPTNKLPVAERESYLRFPSGGDNGLECAIDRLLAAAVRDVDPRPQMVGFRKATLFSTKYLQGQYRRLTSRLASGGESGNRGGSAAPGELPPLPRSHCNLKRRPPPLAAGRNHGSRRGPPNSAERRGGGGIDFPGHGAWCGSRSITWLPLSGLANDAPGSVTASALINRELAFCLKDGELDPDHPDPEREQAFRDGWVEGQNVVEEAENAWDAWDADSDEVDAAYEDDDWDCPPSLTKLDREAALRRRKAKDSAWHNFFVTGQPSRADQLRIDFERVPAGGN